MSSPETSPLPPRVVDLLSRGVSTTVLTGAGVSAESGLATFRGPGGLWEGRDPMELATPQAFAADPELVWRFYAWRREQAAAAAPNAGHHALAAWERRAGGALTVVTQNVDGLHERAGSDPIRLHGSLWRLRCTREERETEDRGTIERLPPRCACGALLRPGVVWFGEALDPGVLARAEDALRRSALVIVAGTSSLVYPAAGLPGLARERGAVLLEVNVEPTPLSPSVDLHLRGPAATVLPRLARVAGIESSLPDA